MLGLQTHRVLSPGYRFLFAWYAVMNGNTTYGNAVEQAFTVEENPYTTGALKVSAILAAVDINGENTKIIPTDTSGDVYYYTSKASDATPVKDASRSKSGTNTAENGLYGTSALTIKVEVVGETDLKLSELLAAAGSEALKVTVSEKTTSALRLSFNAASKYDPASGDNVFAFTAADLLTEASTSGDAQGHYTWNPSKTLYITLNGGTSSTVYSENPAIAASYTISAEAASNA